MVARVNAEAIEELYANLETSEGQKDIYRIAAARDRAGKDIGQMRTIKSATGDVLMRDEYIRERWGQYFSWLMNEENPRVETEEREPNQGLTAPINEAETERALKGMKSGKAVGSDEIPAEVWQCLGWFGVVTLCKLFNSIMITETIPSAWRDNVLVPILMEKGDIQESMLFAEDIVLCGDNDVDMTEYMESWKKALEERGMRVSRPKTQFMDFSFEQNAQGNRTQVKILGEDVERVTHFKYLGTSIEEEGGMETEIAKRVGAGWINWKKCSGVLCDRRMPVKLKG